MPDDHLCQHLLSNLRPGLSGTSPAAATSVTSRRHGISAPERLIRGLLKTLNIPLRGSQPSLQPAHLHTQLAARAAMTPGNNTQANSIQSVYVSLPLAVMAENKHKLFISQILALIRLVNKIYPNAKSTQMYLQFLGGKPLPRCTTRCLLHICADQ